MSKIRIKNNFQHTENIGVKGVKLRNVDNLVGKDLKMMISQPRNTSNMSVKTKNFIQKICYKTGATIDMTRHGFVNDSKLHPINLLMKPLQEKLESICAQRCKRSESSSLTSSFDKSSHIIAHRSQTAQRNPPPTPKDPPTPNNSPRDSSLQRRPTLHVSGINAANTRIRRCLVRKPAPSTQPASETTRRVKKVRLVLPIPDIPEKKTSSKKTGLKNKYR